MRRRWAPEEVVQSSSMDCGPAVVKAALGGFGIPISYGRLREACQTDIDGTSVDMLEDTLNRAGLCAEQIMVPVEHVLLEEADTLPAIVVMSLPYSHHFVLVWRRVGPWVLIMDPARGRRWIRASALSRQLAVHEQSIPARAWTRYAKTDAMTAGLRARLDRLGVDPAFVKSAGAMCRQDGPTAGKLDAATRFVEQLADAGVRMSKTGRRDLLRRLLATPGAVPPAYWSIAQDPHDAGHVEFRASVVVRVRPGATAERPAASGDTALGPELAAALTQRAENPARALLRATLRDGGARSLSLLLILSAVLAASPIAIGLLVSTLLELPRWFADSGAIGSAVALITLALAALTAITFIRNRVETGLSRRVELSFRARFAEAIPRLSVQYFRSRPMSEMGQRAHLVHGLRRFPALLGAAVESCFALAGLLLAVAWLDLQSGAIVAVGAASSLAWPIVAYRSIAETDLAVRTHAGALSRFYLDVLVGHAAARAHAAESAFVGEHESLLTKWKHASLSLARWSTASDTVAAALGVGTSIVVLLAYLSAGNPISGSLVLIYWSLAVPQHAGQLGRLIRRYPQIRSAALRLMEPVQAPLSPVGVSPPRQRPSTPTMVAPWAGHQARGLSVSLRGVSANAGGHRLCHGLGLHVAAGQHVAIVGASGSGKSSLISLVLGHLRASTGQVWVGDRLVDPQTLPWIRRQLVHLDPEVYLWNQSLLENLEFGSDGEGPATVDLLRKAELLGVVEQLPAGLQTPLGEAGRLLSGGEGQRVRFGRALRRARPRLALLDEPFRGLPGSQRTRLLASARHHWAGATMLCVTHDIHATTHFDRVVVMDAGTIVEHGPPAELLANPDSAYARLSAQQHGESTPWQRPGLRQLRLTEGRLVEGAGQP